MGFFKDFKNDFSQAIDELIPEGDLYSEEASDQMVNTLDSEALANTEEAENEMKEWLNEFVQVDESRSDDSASDKSTSDESRSDKSALDGSTTDEKKFNDSIEEVKKGGIEDMDNNIDLNSDDNIDENIDENVDMELLDALKSEEEQEEENKKLDTKLSTASVVDEDSITIISKGTTINGSISSDGSLDVMGNITGDVECLGKLSITGKIVGDSTAAEVYVNSERLEGSINSEGTVKVGLGTVVLGDIVATSGVIAGAVKGEIDINGPIVIDSTAIIKGNIKAKSVQINNGAVIEGFCSLSYSDVDLDNVFE